MKKINQVFSRLVDRIFPPMTDFLFFCTKNNKDLCVKARYYCLRRSLLAVMMLITFIPLGITTGLSFFQYRQLLQDETYSNARWSAENAKQTIEAFLEKLQAAILVVTDAYTFDELNSQEKIDKVFAALKREHKGLVDLSVISPDGIQRAYAGPYNLSGKDYNNSPWYNVALTKKIYVSEVFMGFRNLPHFVIAASKNEPQAQGSWVLRASIDVDTLDRFLASINSEMADDVFLVNKAWQLQSSSRYYGEINTDIIPRDTPKKNGITLTDQLRGTTPILRAVGYVKNTPWILVVEHEGYAQRKSWQAFRNKLLLIFVTCLLLSGVLIVRVATLLARKIREAETSRENLLSQTEHTNKLASIGRLAAGVAHEINNPLAIINEKAGLMQDLLQLASEFKYQQKFLDQLAALQNAVHRTRTITHRLLGFARRMEVTMEAVQINDVVTEVLGFLGKEAEHRNIRIETDLQPDLPSIQSDRGQLQQIFLNIVNNAVDAIDKDGLIRIVSRQHDATGAVQVDIFDNGPGMPPEIMGKIFEPFFTTKFGQEKQGTGLGLSITYGLVKKLGGRIRVKSDVGSGTTFTIVFWAISSSGGISR